MWKGSQHDGHPAPAASGAREDGNPRATLLDDLLAHANPCPTSEEWYRGLNHTNTLPTAAGELWDPVRAMASYKQFCLNQLSAAFDTERGLVFRDDYPDTRATGGVRGLTEAGWNGLYDEFNIRTELEFVKHLLNWHDGEVRFVGEPWWETVEMTRDLYHSRYWHAQTMRYERIGDWCFHNHGGGRKKDDPRKDKFLTWDEVRWIFETEHNENLLMKYCPATGGRPASWQIRQGNYITLGELFVFGGKRCSCWDLYRTYTSLPIFIRKKSHSLSNSEGAIFRAKAKKSKWEKTGRWGLSR